MNTADRAIRWKFNQLTSKMPANTNERRMEQLCVCLPLNDMTIVARIRMSNESVIFWQCRRLRLRQIPSRVCA